MRSKVRAYCLYPYGVSNGARGQNAGKTGLPNGGEDRIAPDKWLWKRGSFLWQADKPGNTRSWRGRPTRRAALQPQTEWNFLRKQFDSIGPVHVTVERPPVKIVACGKEILDPDVAFSVFRVDEDTRKMIPLPGLRAVMSPFNEQATEVALRIREAAPIILRPASIATGFTRSRRVSPEYRLTARIYRL